MQSGSEAMLVINARWRPMAGVVTEGGPGGGRFLFGDARGPLNFGGGIVQGMRGRASYEKGGLRDPYIVIREKDFDNIRGSECYKEFMER